MEVFIKKNNSKKNETGFTLIELLTIIVVLSLIVSIVVLISTSVISKAKNKSYEVTVNNIEKAASGYIIETQLPISWINKGDTGKEYVCVIVQDLIDNGYFKSDILDSYVGKDVKVNNDDFIYLERDSNTKTVEKEILLSQGIDDYDDYFSLCNDVDKRGIINIKYEPIGWSKSKDIFIEYKLVNNINYLSSYRYGYKYNENEIIDIDNVFNSYTEKQNLTVNKNGTIYAEIKYSDGEIISKSLDIDGIDNVGPVISMGRYNGVSSVSESVVIPIVVTDVGVGVDSNSFTTNDLVVSIGNKVITDAINLIKINDNNYNLQINNSVDVGTIKIEIDDNSVFDKLENPNEKVIIDTGIMFNVKYNINYNLQFVNAVKGTKSPIYGTYGNVVYIDNPSYDNYNFKGWSFNGDISIAKYGSDDSVINYWNNKNIKVTDKYFKNLSSVNGTVVTMTANWEVNLVDRIKYLYNKNAKGNNLKKDKDGNIRFYNSNPNNYVKYNNELWRIIGVFNVSDGNKITERIKLVRDDILFDASYDVSAINVNGGCGVNNWPTSSLKSALNDYYSGDSSTCEYYTGSIVKTQHICEDNPISKKCEENFSKLSSTAINMIDNALWYLGGIEMGGAADGDNIIGAEEAFVDEHGNRTGRQCKSSGTAGNCTDKIVRDTRWIGKVALISPSDFGFASGDANCYNDDITYNTLCKNSNWMISDSTFWTLNPRDSNYFASVVWVAKKHLIDHVVGHTNGVRPSVYLKNEVSTVLGIGTKNDPYILVMP